MTITVNEFQSLGASLLEHVRRLHEEVAILDAGVVVARLVPEEQSQPAKPWHVLSGAMVIDRDLTEPVMTEEEVEAGLATEAKNVIGSHAS
jgi:antitoxin (DNA-binding transcriptional repressor) of toxin-antitoxin stability system